MAEPFRGLSATRSVYLELRDERRFVNEGYEFLDEKRMLLAAELLRQAEHYRRVRETYLQASELAVMRLKKAIRRHGLDGLAVYPPGGFADARLGVEQGELLGVILQQAQAAFETSGPQWPAVNPSPEARACARAWLDLLETGVRLAAIEGNLHRLCDEYTRTEHRARALENVMIPEIDAALKAIAEQLESIEQEDVLRVRFRK